MTRTTATLLAAIVLLLAACSRPATGTVIGTITQAGTPDVLPTRYATSDPPAEAPPGNASVPGELFVVLAGAPAGWAPSGGDLRALGGKGPLAEEIALELAATYPHVPGLALYRVNDGEPSGAALTRAANDALEMLNDSPLVSHAFPNWLLATHAEPDDPLFDLQRWHYEQLNLPAAWDAPAGRRDRVTVAVLDTGRFDHPDVQWADGGANFVNWNGAEPQPSEGDVRNFYTNDGGSPHGTNVAGIIGARSNNGVGIAGVNWNVDVLPVKVLAANGTGALSGVLEALTWLSGHESPAYGGHVNDNPPRVVNLSLGSVIHQACPAAIDELFATLADRGMHIVVAAGNGGVPADTTFPANCPSVVTVGATNVAGSRATYSNYGPYIDLMAPGGDSSHPNPANEQLPAMVLSTDARESYAFAQGTSMAAPHVAGAASLLLAAEPHLSREELLARLHAASAPLDASACPPSATGYAGLNQCGAGLLDAEALLSGRELTNNSATVYAVPHKDGEAPTLTYGHLGSLETISPYRATATPKGTGAGYEFRLSGLPQGRYTLIVTETRGDPQHGLSPTDRVGVLEDVQVTGGRTTVTSVGVTRLRDSLPVGEEAGSLYSWR